MAYVGNKNFNGSVQKLAALIPKSNRYFSFCTGMGGLEFSDLLNGINWICAERDTGLHSYIKLHCSTVFSTYQDLVVNFTFNGSDFIFFDPPYVLSSRRSGRKYYKHEWSVSQHYQALQFISATSAMVMLTHPPCKLYFDALPHFKFIPFNYASRHGIFNDGIWVNYDISQLELATTAAVGQNAMERQMIKRKLQSLKRKIDRLSLHEKQMFFALYNIKL